MIKIISAVVLSSFFFLPGMAAAQNNEAQTAFAYATYFVCSPDSESRADEIISTSFKPHYDAAVEHGDILTWSWLQHNVGGKWRRILTMGAADHKILMKARAAIIDEFDDRKVARAAEEINKICHTHQDYMWDILVQTP